MARSPQSAQAPASTATPVDIFTVPSGEKYAVRHVRIHETAGATASYVLRALGGVWGSGLPLQDGLLSAAPASGCFADYNGYTVFLAGDKLQIFTASGAVTATADYDRYIL